jgi:polysaccharide export outer membrane protein
MTGKNIISGRLALAAIGATLLLTAGCGGGNRLIENRAGAVEKVRLDPSAIPSGEDAGDYIIGYGDALDVVFLYNREYNRENIKVRPDGRISFPYVGDIDVAGRTVPWVDSLLTAKYSEIIRDPEITVIVREFQTQQVYVLGQVGDPGAYEYVRGLTLMQALSLGSGLKDSAKRNGVVVVRRIAWDHVIGIEIDVKEILDNDRFDMDIPIKPFDIVMVPKSKLATTEDFIESVSNILISPADVYLKGWSVANVKTQYDFYRRIGQTP